MVFCSLVGNAPYIAAYLWRRAAFLSESVS